MIRAEDFLVVTRAGLSKLRCPGGFRGVQSRILSVAAFCLDCLPKAIKDGFLGVAGASVIEKMKKTLFDSTC